VTSEVVHTAIGGPDLRAIRDRLATLEASVDAIRTKSAEVVVPASCVAAAVFLS
jgi:hypothetical protein